MKVSIITCSLNHGRFINHTIASVLSQNWRDLEYVVVDGGSTDNTLDVLKSYGDRITWISEKDSGQSEAINKGIEMTSGQIVGWVCSDDIYYPHAIEQVASFFAANSDVDVVYGNADFIDIDGKVYETFPASPWDPVFLRSHCFICQPATFIRRTVIDRCGLLNTNLHYCMDYEYWLRLAERDARFAHLESKLAGSRMYPANKTLKVPVARSTEINHMLIERIGFVPDSWIYDYTDAIMVQSGRLKGSPGDFERELRAMWYAVRWNGRLSRRMIDQFPTWLRKSRLLKWVPRGTWSRVVKLFGG